MKVEIVTLHRITNFGSMLQTYATQTAIEKLGHQAEILDFVPIGMTYKRALFPAGNTSFIIQAAKFIPRFICLTTEFAVMKDFIKRYIKVSPKLYHNYQEILDDIPDADVYLSGSDQVWNTQNHNPDDDLKAYYLGFAPKGKKRVAYAGSFGKNDFTETEIEIMKEYLTKYNAISVREDDGLNVLQRLGFNNGVHVVDPTLLLSGEEWKDFASEHKKPKGNYIFVYNLNRNKLIKEIAVRLSKETGLKIINFADTYDFIPGAKNRLVNNAFDFINHIADAEYVVTDSFHGTAFSINLNRNVVAVKAPRYNSRLESILRLTGMQSRMVENVEAGVKIAMQPIDFVEVNKKLNAAREISWNYLKKALEG